MVATIVTLIVAVVLAIVAVCTFIARILIGRIRFFGFDALADLDNDDMPAILWHEAQLLARQCRLLADRLAQEGVGEKHELAILRRAQLIISGMLAEMADFPFGKRRAPFIRLLRTLGRLQRCTIGRNNDRLREIVAELRLLRRAAFFMDFTSKELLYGICRTPR